MRPVMQTKFGKPEGNCFAACIASILELPLDAVEVPGTEGWGDILDDWCKANGYGYIWLDTAKIIDKIGSGKDSPYYWSEHLHWIATGPSTRTQGGEPIRHAIVCLGGEMLHDPNPEGTFITEVEDAVLVFRHPATPQSTLESR